MFKVLHVAFVRQLTLESNTKSSLQYAYDFKEKKTQENTRKIVQLQALYRQLNSPLAFKTLN